MRVIRRPLTVRECADYLGFTTEWIRRAITAGVRIEGAETPVKLEAERIVLKGRTHYRIHEDTFRAFLIDIGWKRLARRTDEARSHPPAALVARRA